MRDVQKPDTPTLFIAVRSGTCLDRTGMIIRIIQIIRIIRIITLASNLPKTFGRVAQASMQIIRYVAVNLPPLWYRTSGNARPTVLVPCTVVVASRSCFDVLTSRFALRSDQRQLIEQFARRHYDIFHIYFCPIFGGCLGVFPPLSGHTRL